MPTLWRRCTPCPVSYCSGKSHVSAEGPRRLHPFFALNHRLRRLSAFSARRLRARRLAPVSPNRGWRCIMLNNFQCWFRRYVLLISLYDRFRCCAGGEASEDRREGHQERIRPSDPVSMLCSRSGPRKTPSLQSRTLAYRHALLSRPPGPRGAYGHRPRPLSFRCPALHIPLPTP